MPYPSEGESEKEYMARCIPMLIEEGKQRDQAVAICFSMWERGAKPAKQAEPGARADKVGEGDE